MHQANEVLRKSLHIAFGLFAFALRWLPWQLAALIALGAVFSNWLLLHRLLGTRVSRHERGFDAGTVLYPVAVLVLILVFRHRLDIAALCWVILAFGDGVASMAGKAVPIARIPWNRDKSWGGLIAFLIAGAAGALAVFTWFGNSFNPTAAMIAVLAAGIAETLPLGIDDNLTVPFAASVTFVIASLGPAAPFFEYSAPWLIANTVLAIAGLIANSVDVSGAVAGWILGSILIVCSGYPLYLALLSFFIIGTACTKLGYARKARLGLAQEKGGRRGASHAIANVGVAALCALAVSGDGGHGAVAMVMGIAALATAAADTTASEIGQLFGRRAFLPVTFRRVEVGTEGAISVEGTMAGLFAGFAVSTTGMYALTTLFGLNWKFFWVATAAATVAAFVGSYAESIIGSWNRKSEKPIPNGTLNFVNTVIGAMVVWTAWQIAI